MPEAVVVVVVVVGEVQEAAVRVAAVWAAAVWAQAVGAWEWAATPPTVRVPALVRVPEQESAQVVQARGAVPSKA